MDHLKKPLDAKVLYHCPCGSFFNFSTVKQLYNVEADGITDTLIATLQSKTCAACDTPLKELRTCYPHSAEAIEEPAFDNLSAVANYSVQGLVHTTQKERKDD